MRKILFLEPTIRRLRNSMKTSALTPPFSLIMNLIWPREVTAEIRLMCGTAPQYSTRLWSRPSCPRCDRHGDPSAYALQDQARFTTPPGTRAAPHLRAGAPRTSLVQADHEVDAEAPIADVTVRDGRRERALDAAAVELRIRN